VRSIARQVLSAIKRIFLLAESAAQFRSRTNSMPLVQRACLRAPYDLVFEEISIKNSLHAGEIYAETLYSALSIGTETAAYIGQPPLRPGIPYPRLLGYCNVAVIRKLGCETSLYKEGDIILTTQSHQSGFICPETGVLGKIPKEVDLKSATLTYLPYLGASSLKKALYRPGEWVGVLGLGPIGLATINLLSCYKANAIAMGRREDRLRLSRRLGAAASLDTDDPKLIKQVQSLTQNRGVDVLVTTANTWEAWRLALEVTRAHGRIAVLGFPGRNEPIPTDNPLDPTLFYLKQLNILSCGYISEWQKHPVDALKEQKKLVQAMINLMKQKKLVLSELISDAVPYIALESMYKKAMAKEPHFVTAVLSWPAAEGHQT
jgi:threonine dehydrogenase-like Zn-dependent dehydrogenase